MAHDVDNCAVIYKGKTTYTVIVRKSVGTAEKVDGVDESHPSVARNTRLHFDTVTVQSQWPANIIITVDMTSSNACSDA